MNVLVLIYTLCLTPQYVTVLDGNEISLWTFDQPSISAIRDKYEGDNISIMKVPLDSVTKGKCS